MWLRRLARSPSREGSLHPPGPSRIQACEGGREERPTKQRVAAPSTSRPRDALEAPPSRGRPASKGRRNHRQLERLEQHADDTSRMEQESGLMDRGKVLWWRSRTLLLCGRHPFYTVLRHVQSGKERRENWTQLRDAKTSFVLFGAFKLGFFVVSERLKFF